jgi:hypothetical protein
VYKDVNIKIYKIIILSRYENLSLIIRGENRLKVFENGLLRRIFGPKRDEIIRGWKNLLSEELHNLCSLANVIGMIKSRSMR